MDDIKFIKWNESKLEFTCEKFINWNRIEIMELDTSEWEIKKKTTPQHRQPLHNPIIFKNRTHISRFERLCFLVRPEDGQELDDLKEFYKFHFIQPHKNLEPVRRMQ